MAETKGATSAGVSELEVLKTRVDDLEKAVAALGAQFVHTYHPFTDFVNWLERKFPWNQKPAAKPVVQAVPPSTETKAP